MCTLAGQQHVARHRRAEQARPCGDKPDLAAAHLVGAPGHVDEVLGLGASDVRVAPLRLAGRDLSEHVGDVGRGDRLDEQRAIVATPFRSVQLVTIAAKSWNWVAGTIVQGTEPACTRRSCSRLPA